MLYLNRTPNSTSFKLDYDWILLIVILFRFLSPITTELCFVILAGYVLLGKQQIIKGLIITWFINNINPGAGYVSVYASMLKYIIICSSFFSIMLRFKFQKIDKLITYTFLFCIFLLIHSLNFSFIPMVSILKVLVWTLLILTLLMTWSSMSAYQYEQIQQWILKFCKFFILVSLFIYLFTNIGYLDSGNNFQGVLKHPQAFGVTIALFSVLILGQILFKKKLSLESAIFLLLCFILIILSKTRTAFFATILVMIFSIPLASLFHKRSNTKNSLLKNKRFLAVVVIMISLFGIDKITLNFVDNFINKRTYIPKNEMLMIEGDYIPGTDIVTNYINSRALLYVPSLNNINKYPLTGIGFGVGSKPEEMTIYYDPILGLPLGAPTEKGLILMMILEELGYFGLLIFLLWVWYLIICSVKNHITYFMIVLIIFILNMGEALLFSPGGPGMIFIIFLTLSIIKPKLK
ncbi:O-antigen ligase family protein [Candidatus Pelagibacter sp.]|jgi:hypothetical protein|nr:O-antigen ligase family protein [Candidatus Pelagibacter sp.]